MDCIYKALFLTSGPLKLLTIIAKRSPTHSQTQPRKATAGSSGAVRLRSRRHSHPLGGARDHTGRTSRATAAHGAIIIITYNRNTCQSPPSVSVDGWLHTAHSPPPCWVKYCSMLSQSILVRQKMMAWSILCSVMALMVYSPFNSFTASDHASRQRENSV